MINLAFGLACQSGGSYMQLIFAPFNVMPNWSGYIPVYGGGGHSHGSIGRIEEQKKDYEKLYAIAVDIQENHFEKRFKVKYPLPKLKVINISIRKTSGNGNQE